MRIWFYENQIEYNKANSHSLLSDIKAIEIPRSFVVQSLQSNTPDVEKGLQYYSALHHLDHFISRDKPLIKHAIPQLPVGSPRVFLDKIL